jgi:hypothetical protein
MLNFRLRFKANFHGYGLSTSFKVNVTYSVLRKRFEYKFQRQYSI